MKRGKMSTIRYKSNRRMWVNGRMKSDKGWEEIVSQNHTKYLQEQEELKRPPKYRRKQGGEWITL